LEILAKKNKNLPRSLEKLGKACKIFAVRGGGEAAAACPRQQFIRDVR
jgi:hypothetical protein